MLPRIARASAEEASSLLFHLSYIDRQRDCVENVAPLLQDAVRVPARRDFLPFAMPQESETRHDPAANYQPHARAQFRSKLSTPHVR
jgi:hypothetical protein